MLTLDEQIAQTRANYLTSKARAQHLRGQCDRARGDLHQWLLDGAKQEENLRDHYARHLEYLRLKKRRDASSENRAAYADAYLARRA